MMERTKSVDLHGMVKLESKVGLAVAKWVSGLDQVI